MPRTVANVANGICFSEIQRPHTCFSAPGPNRGGGGADTGGVKMAGRGMFVTALALLSLAAPRVLQAQAKPATPAAGAPAAAAAAQAPLDPKLVEFAKLHAILNQARDDFFAKIGRTHDD